MAICAEPELHRLRAARREAVRAAALAKTGEPAPFGLLVLPVDFADARFEAGFRPRRDLWPRLAAEAAGSLRDYYRAASLDRTELRIVLAPVIHLPGSRLDYSDLGWQGLSRTRAMAGQALARAAAMGLGFDASDLDADGEVDGVLILHAAPGLENATDGLIVPLQYFLDEPVLQSGVLARSYAVASARSSLGIWAHEVGHLLGLEDRYDPAFTGSSEVAPRGGLVRYSLMASGWLGSGRGEDPALPDAYSRLLLGWIDLGPQPTGQTAVRLDLRDGPGPEFFLVERRFPGRWPPYDAALPPSRLLVLHVDERLAEGQPAGDHPPERRLRVNLVQADGGQEVADGSSQGQDGDLFPADGIGQVFDDRSVPSSRTFAGMPSGVAFTVDVSGQALVFASQADHVLADLRLTFEIQDGTITPRVQARLLAADPAPSALTATFTCVSTEWGAFTSGAVLDVTLTRVDAGAGGWSDYQDLGLPPWQPAASVPSDAVTRFRYVLHEGDAGGGWTSWPWGGEAAALDLQGPWPGDWEILYPTGDQDTRWHRWADGPGGDGLMLACTGAAAADGGDWPDVRYGNRAHAVLRSPPLGDRIRWVGMTHAVDLELQYPGLAVDGATVSWLHANGRTVVEAEPADGWLGRSEPRAWHALAGRPTFAVADSLSAGPQRPLWRREVLPLPAAAEHGPGPWRLQLELASNALWRARGWLVRDLAGRTDGPPPAGAFPVSADGQDLAWIWPGPAPADSFTVQASGDGGLTWQAAGDARPGGRSGQAALETLVRGEGERTLLRVVAHLGPDAVASRDRAVVTQGRAVLGRPYPNPARELAHLPYDGIRDRRAALGLYDLRGRLLRRWPMPAQAGVLTWDGTDAAGRPVPAGVYIYRLQDGGRSVTRKVTWLR